MLVHREQPDRGALDRRELAPELRRCQRIGQIRLDGILDRQYLEQAVEWRAPRACRRANIAPLV